MPTNNTETLIIDVNAIDVNEYYNAPNIYNNIFVYTSNTGTALIPSALYKNQAGKFVPYNGVAINYNVNSKLLIVNADSFETTVTVNKNYYWSIRPETIISSDVITNTLEVREQNTANSIANLTTTTIVPEYIREDYPEFCGFLETYYKWLEGFKHTLNITGNIRKYLDIDSTIDIFYEHFYREYLVNIPRNIQPNKATVLKHIKDFYKAKGTEDSYRFLFRLLYGTDPEFYIPHTDLFKLSDGKWITNTTIHIVATPNSKISPLNLLNKKIRGLKYNTSAFVEKINTITIDYYTVYELFLNQSSITGDFNNEVAVTCDELNTDDYTFIANLSTMVVDTEVSFAGKGFKVGDILKFEDITGRGATATVSAVNSDGGILSLDITNGGCNYTSDIDYNIIVVVGKPTLSADISIKLGKIIEYTGYFLNSDSCLSNLKYLQDSYYYQQYSYVIKAPETIQQYGDIVKKLVHPAGQKLFSDVYIVNHIKAYDENDDDSLTTHCEIIRKFSQFPYRPTRFPYKPHQRKWPKCIDWQEAIDCRMTIYTEISYLINSKLLLGPTYSSIERNKFYFNLSNRYCNLPTDDDYNVYCYSEPYYNGETIEFIDSIDQTSENANYWFKEFNVPNQTFIDGKILEFVKKVIVVPLDNMPVYEITITVPYYKAVADFGTSSSVSDTLNINGNGLPLPYGEMLESPGCASVIKVGPAHIGNTQIKDFKNLIIGDFKKHPKTKTNIMPDSEIRIRKYSPL